MTDINTEGYDDEIVTQAFILQRTISKKGTPGIDFSGAIVDEWEDRAESVIGNELTKQLSKKGF